MKLSISGLPKDLFEADLEQLFAPYGRVNFAAVYFDSISMKNRGKGMVDMRDPVEAERAQKALNGKVLGQHTMKVKIEPDSPFAPPRRDEGFSRDNRGSDRERPSYDRGDRGQQQDRGSNSDYRMRRRTPLKRND